MKIEDLIASLTIDHARAWNATNEKTLFVDYEILCDAGFRLSTQALDLIEARLEALLETH